MIWKMREKRVFKIVSKGFALTFVLVAIFGVCLLDVFAASEDVEAVSEEAVTISEEAVTVSEDVLEVSKDAEVIPEDEAYPKTRLPYPKMQRQNTRVTMQILMSPPLL